MAAAKIAGHLPWKFHQSPEGTTCRWFRNVFHFSRFPQSWGYQQINQLIFGFSSINHPFMVPTPGHPWHMPYGVDEGVDVKASDWCHWWI